MKSKPISDDGLGITINDDGKVEFEWDCNDPRWNWLNDLTNDEIFGIINQDSTAPFNNETIPGDSLDP